MSEKILFLLILCGLIFNPACQSSGTTNKNAATLSANTGASANIPPEFSGTPSIMTNSTPGIPDPKSANLNVSNLTTPIPGITDLKNNGKPTPKNTPPIPGIPSEAELKRQMNTPITNSKMMERKPPVGEPNSPAVPASRPRKGNKP